MPRRPLSSCTVPGCPNKVERPGRCAAHQRVYEQHNDQERGTATERGYGAEWRRIRAKHLHDNPWCVECLNAGAYTPATDVDHRLPRRLGGSDDESNLDSLCHKHHSAKTMRELNQKMRGG